ncbi:uncharacterized protein [Physcomitrium patens]|uniref:uncharacterized protein isoform X2 n=1 Tax=Physcomitrium patens TaxID=3218 RepID=UPI003CCD4882
MSADGCSAVPRYPQQHIGLQDRRLAVETVQTGKESSMTWSLVGPHLLSSYSVSIRYFPMKNLVEIYKILSNITCIFHK